MATTPLPLPILFTVLSLLSSRGAASNVLLSATRLTAGESLTHRHPPTGKRYTLTMQTDCNLVLYDDGETIWSTSTAGGHHCYLTLRSNGELAIHRARSLIPVWTLNTASSEGSYALVLRYDGSLRVYGPTVWSIAPSLHRREKFGPKFSRPASTPESELYTGDVARAGTAIANGDYALVLQDSCSLVLVNNKSGEILCETKHVADRRSSEYCYLTLSSTGQLRMGYIGGGEPFWVNGKMSDYGDYVMVLHADGRLAIYGPSIWSGGKADGIVAAPAGSHGLHAGKVSVGFTCKIGVGFV